MLLLIQCSFSIEPIFIQLIPLIKLQFSFNLIQFALILCKHQFNKNKNKNESVIRQCGTSTIIFILKIFVKFWMAKQECVVPYGHCTFSGS